MNPIATYQLDWQIRFVDTDASGFAHFSSYVRMMEETEYAFLRSRGLSVILKDERGSMGFPRLTAQLKIVQPMAFEELATIRLSLTEIDGKQIVYDFNIMDEAGRSAVTGRFTNAFCRFPIGKPPRAILIPEYVMSALAPDDPIERVAGFK